MADPKAGNEGVPLPSKPKEATMKKLAPPGKRYGQNPDAKGPGSNNK